MSEKSYVKIEDVQNTCKELGLRDWTKLETPEIDNKEADVIRNIIEAETLAIPLGKFRKGIEVELEHGIQFPDANVTNNHPILTGRIVLAHLKEGLDYYLRLECMELEMDLAKAVASCDLEKSAEVGQRLAESRERLEAKTQAS